MAAQVGRPDHASGTTVALTALADGRKSHLAFTDASLPQLREQHPHQRAATVHLNHEDWNDAAIAGKCTYDSVSPFPLSLSRRRVMY